MIGENTFSAFRHFFSPLCLGVPVVPLSVPSGFTVILGLSGVNAGVIRIFIPGFSLFIPVLTCFITLIGIHGVPQESNIRMGGPFKKRLSKPGKVCILGQMIMIRMRYHLAAGLMVASLIVPMTASDCRGQTAPSLPPGVQDVVKLVKAGMDDEVVLAQIRNGTTVYNLSVDQIIYLHDQGVSQNVIKALLATGSASAPASPAPAPAPLAVPQTAAPVVVTPPPVVAATPVAVVPGVPAAQPLSLDSFQAQLAPFGTWMDVPGFGLCWRPAVAVSDPYWRPYCDQGHWVYTADGWFWQSDTLGGTSCFITGVGSEGGWVGFGCPDTIGLPRGSPGGIRRAFADGRPCRRVRCLKRALGSGSAGVWR